MMTPEEMDAHAAPGAVDMIGIKPSIMQMHCNALYQAMMDAARSYLDAQGISEVAKIICFQITAEAMQKAFENAMERKP